MRLVLSKTFIFIFVFSNMLATWNDVGESNGKIKIFSVYKKMYTLLNL